MTDGLTIRADGIHGCIGVRSAYVPWGSPWAARRPFGSSLADRRATSMVMRIDGEGRHEDSLRTLVIDNNIYTNG